MIPLLLALSSPLPPAQPPWYGGRIVNAASVHVGVRPQLSASAGEIAVGFTVQVSTNAL